jgi:hypothetical protein
MGPVLLSTSFGVDIYIWFFQLFNYLVTCSLFVCGFTLTPGVEVQMHICDVCGKAGIGYGRIPGYACGAGMRGDAVHS